MLDEDSTDEKKDILKAKEIQGMELIWVDNYIMMICSDAKSYYVFDEENTEESEFLRQVTGGHKEEITIMRYDDH